MCLGFPLLFTFYQSPFHFLVPFLPSASFSMLLFSHYCQWSSVPFPPPPSSTTTSCPVPMPPRLLLAVPVLCTLSPWYRHITNHSTHPVPSCYPSSVPQVPSRLWAIPSQLLSMCYYYRLLLSPVGFCPCDPPPASCHHQPGTIPIPTTVSHPLSLCLHTIILFSCAFLHYQPISLCSPRQAFFLFPTPHAWR